MHVTGNKITMACVSAVWLALLTSGCGNLICDPPKPENLGAVPESPHTIVLFWDGPAYDYCAGHCSIDYSVYRNGKLVGSGLWQYEDSGLAPATLYCYVVESSYGYCEYCEDDYYYENGDEDCSEIFSSLLWINWEEKRSRVVCVETFPLSNISGTVTSFNSGIGDIEIDLIAVFPYRGSFATLTGAAGNYRFTDLENGNYLIAPSDTAFTFIPETREILIHNGDITGLDFEVRE